MRRSRFQVKPNTSRIGSTPANKGPTTIKNGSSTIEECENTRSESTLPEPQEDQHDDSHLDSSNVNKSEPSSGDTYDTNPKFTPANPSNPHDANKKNGSISENLLEDNLGVNSDLCANSVREKPGGECTNTKPSSISNRFRMCKPKPNIVPRTSARLNQGNSKSEANSIKNAANSDFDSNVKLPTTSAGNASTVPLDSFQLRPENVTSNPSSITCISDSVGNGIPLQFGAPEANVAESSGGYSTPNEISYRADNQDLPVIEEASLNETTCRQPSTTENTSTSSGPPPPTKNPVKPRKKPIRSYKPGANPPERGKMKMMDLIFWNPNSNPMKKKPEVLPGNVANDIDSGVVAEEDEIDNPTTTPDSEPEEDSALPAPRVTIGEDGQIIIDETSLVIKQTPTGKDISTQEIVYDTSDTTYASFKKPKDKLKPFWTLQETARFYKTLSIVGTDFTLMATLFPERSRLDLKNKFKKEERTRKLLIDKAMREWHNFDLNEVESFLAEDTLEQALKLADKTKEKRKRQPKNTDKTNTKNDGSNSPNKQKKALDKKPPANRKRKVTGKKAENEDAEYESSVPKIHTKSKKNITGQLKGVVNQANTPETKKRKLHSLSPSLSDSTIEYPSPSTVEYLSPPTIEYPSHSSINKETINKTPRPPSNPPRNMLPFMSGSTVELIHSPSQLSDSSSYSFNKPSTSSTEKLNPMNSGNLKPTTSNGSGTPSNSKEKQSETNVDIINRQLSEMHPTLHSLLNQANKKQDSSDKPGTSTTTNIDLSVGQLILVASRTPTNEQVVHVYLVSPSTTTQPANANNASSSSNANAQNKTVASTKTQSSMVDASLASVPSPESINNFGVLPTVSTTQSSISILPDGNTCISESTNSQKTPLESLGIVQLKSP